MVPIGGARKRFLDLTSHLTSPLELIDLQEEIIERVLHQL